MCILIGIAYNKTKSLLQAFEPHGWMNYPPAQQSFSDTIALDKYNNNVI